MGEGRTFWRVQDYPEVHRFLRRNFTRISYSHHIGQRLREDQEPCLSLPTHFTVKLFGHLVGRVSDGWSQMGYSATDDNSHVLKLSSNSSPAGMTPIRSCTGCLV